MRERARLTALAAPSRSGEKPGRRTAKAGVVEAMLQLQRTVGNRATTGLASHARLTVGRDSDLHEHRADALADHIMRAMRAPAGAVGVLPDEVPAPPAKHRHATAGSDPLGGLPVDPAIEADIERARGRGRHVPPQLRQVAEAAMGTDLGRARIHDDARADQLSRSLQAKAFTSGTDIFVRKRGFDPSSASGRATLAHELAHVPQQDGTVRRLLKFDGKRLEGKTSTKASVDHSTFVQLREAHARYENVALKDPKKEEQALHDMSALMGKWMKKHAPQGFVLEPKNKSKLQALLDLNSAITAEIPLINRRVAGRGLTEKVGLSPLLVEELDLEGIYGLLRVDTALGAGRVADADAELTALRATLGDGMVDLVRSMLFRRHIGLFKQSGMTEVYENTDFRLKDPAEVAVGKQQTQTYGTARATELKNDPDSSDEYRFHGKTLTDISAGAAKKRTDIPSELEAVKSKVAVGTLTKEQQTEYGKSAKAIGKLTDEEIGAILGYTTNLFEKFNSPLRGDLTQLQPGDKAATKLAVSGLNKLPKYSGLVYRHLSNFAGYAQVNRVGAVVVDMAFVSTAVSQQSCVTAAKYHQVLEIIQSKSGRNVSLISAFGIGEAEVMFRPGTRFKVEKVAVKQNNAWPDEDSRKHAEATVKSPEIQMVVYKREL